MYMFLYIIPKSICAEYITVLYLIIGISTVHHYGNTQRIL